MILCVWEINCEKQLAVFFGLGRLRGLIEMGETRPRNYAVRRCYEKRSESQSKCEQLNTVSVKLGNTPIRCVHHVGVLWAKLLLALCVVFIMFMRLCQCMVDKNRLTTQTRISPTEQQSPWLASLG